MVLAARALAKDATGISLDVAGEKRQGALNRNFRASDLQQPREGDQHRRGRAAGGGDGERGAARAGACRRQGLQDRAAATTRSTASAPIRPRPSRTTASRWCSRSPSRSRSSAASSSPTICRPASRSTIRGWCPRAIPARCRGSRTPRSRSNAEFRDDRFSRGLRAQERAIRRCSPWPMWCARCRRARYVLPQAYVEDMYRPDRFGRTATGTIEVTARNERRRTRRFSQRACGDGASAVWRG